MELSERIMELAAQGLQCSQIMMQLSLDLREREEPFTIRALGALGGGMYVQRTCGVLSGGVAMLSSYFDRAKGDPEPEEYKVPAAQLATWFEAEMGSIDCRDLVIFDREHMMKVCPGMIEKTFLKCLEILEEHGIDAAE